MTAPSQSTLLVDLAEALYEFGVSETHEPFALEVDGPSVALPLRGGRHSLRAALAAAFVRNHGKAPSAQALADAMLVVEGRAQLCGPRPLALRVARTDDGSIIVDLGGPAGHVVVVEPGAWRVEDRSPVLWRRTELTSALPVPQPGGDLDELRHVLGVDSGAFELIVGWLVAALLPDIPHPVLALRGEQGVGKSTRARFIVSLIDPSPAPLRTAPRDVEGWAVAASGSYCVALDNVSVVKEWLSDAICRGVTGDGLVRRALYTNSSLSVLAFRRCIILTTIDAGALRGDLAERLLPVDLGRIDPSDRREERDLDAEFAAVSPRMLGAVLDVLARVLDELPKVTLDRRPRMADFATVLAAVDATLGTRSLDRYLGIGQRLTEEVVEDDPVLTAIRDLVEERGTWCGTASELHGEITPDPVPYGWPNPRAMIGRVRRGVPALRAVGVHHNESRSGAQRLHTLTREPPQNSVTSVIAGHRHQMSDASDRIRASGPASSDGRDADDGSGATLLLPETGARTETITT